MNLEKFKFHTQELRTFTDDAGEPWFMASDICRMLEIANASQACARLDDDEKMALDANVYKTYIGSEGGKAPIIISEPGLYRLMGTSNSPKAKPFTRWLNHEVLPTLRKTGTYQMAPMNQDEYTIALANQALALVADKQALQAKIEAQKPDVEFAQAIKASDHLRSVSIVAKTIGKGCGQQRLFDFLRANKIVYYYDGSNVPYQQYVDRGWFKIVEKPYNKKHRNGDVTPSVSQKTMVTGLGEEKIIALWKKRGLPIRSDSAPKK